MHMSVHTHSHAVYPDTMLSNDFLGAGHSKAYLHGCTIEQTGMLKGSGLNVSLCFDGSAVKYVYVCMYVCMYRIEGSGCALDAGS